MTHQSSNPIKNPLAMSMGGRSVGPYISETMLTQVCISTSNVLSIRQYA